MKQLFIIISLILFFIIINAENKAQDITPKIGLGITCNNVIEKGIYEGRYNENPFSFLLIYNLGPNFRLETTLFYQSYKREQLKIDRIKTDYSIGVFRRKEKERLINYYGLRLGQIYDNKDGEVKGNYIIPIVGSEFKVIKHFNIGCEFGMNFLKYTLIEESEKYENTYNRFISKFIIRYYL